MRDIHAVVLAAGQGTRMRSARPKVLHEIAGRSLLSHVLAAAAAAGASRYSVVVGPDAAGFGVLDRPEIAALEFFVQQERRGTAHAVLQARAALNETQTARVLVLYGDTPLILPETLTALCAALDGGPAVAVLGFEASIPAGYGRLVTDAGGALIAIREDKDASAAERAITLCNSGIMAFAGDRILPLLDRIGNANSAGEYYLTDAVEAARSLGLPVAYRLAAEDEVRGVNTRAQLAEAEAIAQKRLRLRAMSGGATLVDPATVTFSADTVLGQDVTVEPNVIFGRGVVVEDGATVKGFSHIEGAHVGAGAIAGPFARLRPGTRLGAGARVGNFVELKEAAIHDGAKVSHLSYIGDADVGAGANIGAGTVTCNYDGFEKHKTVIGADAFIGSNTSLIAPVKIGDGAYVGSGSVITADVPEGALAVARSPQVLREGWVRKFRLRRDRAAKP